jgi:DNA-directed RNA polymerase subunit F
MRIIKLATPWVKVPRIVSETNLTLAEIVEILEKEESKRELSTLERYTLDYARKFAKIKDPQSARKAVKQLMKEMGLPEEIAVQLVNIAPRDPGEVRLILAPLTKVFEEEDLRRIIEIIKSYSQ